MMISLPSSHAPESLREHPSVGVPPASALSRQAIYQATFSFLTLYLNPLNASKRPAMMALLRPQPSDFERVFVLEAAEKARAHYEPLWEAMPLIIPSGELTDVRLTVSLSEELGMESEQARSFPGGYRKIHSMLQPGLFWCAWKFKAPGKTSGLAFDGLVWLDGRWAFFPKPWRML